MANRKDYYEILGVSKDATAEEIKKAYRNLAKKYHPDTHPGDRQAEAKFKEINEAHSVLHDPKRRREYDLGERVIFEGMPGWQGGPAPGGFDAAGFGFNVGGMEDLFSDLFGGRASRAPRRGTDIEYVLEVDFLHAVKGTEVELTVKRGGASEKTKVRIPAGVHDGSHVRVAGRGNPGMHGGPAGDLFIATRVRPHPYFRRKGDDIYVDVPVTVPEATLGTTISVPTVDGPTKIKIPPGTQGAPDAVQNQQSDCHACKEDRKVEELRREQEIRDRQKQGSYYQWVDCLVVFDV